MIVTKIVQLAPRILLDIFYAGIGSHQLPRELVEGGQVSAITCPFAIDMENTADGFEVSC